MTKIEKLSIVVGFVLASMGILKMDWNADNLSILLTGAVLGVSLAALIVWWRFK
jgi:uncharacterized membrane protein